MKKVAIIVAGGEGTRLGGALPKQFLELSGRPVLWWSMKAFRDEDTSTDIIVVINPKFAGTWEVLSERLPESERISHSVVLGGESRTRSVANGLALLGDEPDALVAIHDAARPGLTVEMIRRGWKSAGEHGAAVPVVAVTDSIRIVGDGESRALDRNSLAAVQTPQVFRSQLLVEAYKHAGEGVYSDDATVVEASGHSVACYEGDVRNLKITHPGDLERVGAMLKMEG